MNASSAVARQGVGLLIIGDEITRGKRQDKHFSKVVELLAARGLVLDWAMYLGDDRERLTETLRRTMRETLASGDIVFSCGGIGATPDDHTRQAAAAAAGVELQLHPEAAALIRERLQELKRDVTEDALGMARFPAGAGLVPNPFNRIAGFSLGSHYFVPGFPQMAWPMIEWVLDTYYADRFNREPTAEAAILVWDGIESILTPMMQRIEADFSGLKVFSLPSLGTPDRGRHIELGVRGVPDQVAPAMDVLRREVAALGYRFDET
jgi:molybdopterin-biosynthesis enzyme MoeA-like protein